jgi:hypothetical protein
MSRVVSAKLGPLLSGFFLILFISDYKRLQESLKACIELTTDSACELASIQTEQTDQTVEKSIKTLIPDYIDISRQISS